MSYFPLRCAWLVVSLPCLSPQVIVAVAINKERPLLPASTPPRLAALISRCWQEDPRQRPRAAAVAAELQDLMQVRRVGLGLVSASLALLPHSKHVSMQLCLLAALEDCASPGLLNEQLPVACMRTLGQAGTLA